MKKSGVCPKCGGRKLYAVEPAEVSDPRYANGTEPFVVACAVLTGGDAGFFGGKLEKVTAQVDAWVCGGCGNTELYARDVTALARMAEQGLGNVRVVGA